MHIQNHSVNWGTHFYLYLSALAASLLLVGITEATADVNDGKQLPAFKAGVLPREYGTGAHVGVFGGANIAQTGDLDGDLGAVHLTAKTKNQIGGVAGIRGGYTWPGFGSGSGFSDPSPLPVDGGFAVLPSLEYEVFWTGLKYKANGTAPNGMNFQFSSDVNTYVFSLDPKIGFQVGMFRPYIGFGVGGAYVSAENPSLTVNGLTGTSTESNDDFCLALQGLAGVEVFVSKNWAVTIDYKYLDLVNPKFGQVSSDNIGQHIVTAGVNFYF